MKISIIIPVYNAAPFLRRAVESALSQPETEEIVLIEDGSKDNSLEICRQLAIEFNKVKLFTHPGNQNKGAGLSRNYGIEKASCEYISFLDADDFFLADRFRAERKIFAEKPNTDGVYGALGFQYDSESGKERYKVQSFSALSTMSASVPPEELFYALAGMRNVTGHFTICTLTLKKSIFPVAEMFSGLKMHEDTEFILKLSITNRLEAGVLDKPIGLRGVHDNNRIVNISDKAYTTALLYERMYQWTVKRNLPAVYQLILKSHYRVAKIHTLNKVAAFFYLCMACLQSAFFIKHMRFFNISVKAVFGDNAVSNLIIRVKEKIQLSIFKSDPKA